MKGFIKHFYLKCKLRHDLFKTFQIVHKGLVFIHLFCLSPCDATSTTTILLPKGLLDNHLYIQCSLHEYSYGLIQSENRLYTSKNNMTYVTYHNIFPLQGGCYNKTNFQCLYDLDIIRSNSTYAYVAYDILL